MVTLGGDAEMTCDIPGCLASAGVLFCLTPAGGFVFKPLQPDWQVRMPVVAQGPFQTLCPKHKVTVEPVRPVIQGVP